jgi:hypothetical protein
MVYHAVSVPGAVCRRRKHDKSVFHIIVRWVNQIAQIIQGRNILCQYVGDYKRCNELASWQQMMCNNKEMGREWIKRIHLHDGDNRGSGASSGSEVP